MGFFIFAVVVVLGGALIHTFVDRSPQRRTTRRVVELWLIWIVAIGGLMSIIGGYGHVGPDSTDIAEDIGYRQSFFQWEVGWGDIALGVVGFLTIWFRGSFLTAAVLVLLIQYWGDGIGHIMRYVQDDNTEPGNIWSMPTDFGFPLAAAILLIAYRRLSPTTPRAPAPAVGAPRAPSPER
jgi:hypothetical protein